MQRGEIWWAILAEPIGKRPVLLISRNRAIQVRESVTVALITRTIRHIPVEVFLGPEDNLPRPCVVNLDNLQTIPKKILSERISILSPQKMAFVEKALKFALELV